ncbi:MAG: methyl-accepting chemotaxis protein [Rubripirellula sp.]
MSAAQPPKTAQSNQQGVEPHDVNVTEMVGDLSVALDSAIGEIHSVNAETKILALNARIEAARAGRHGAAFGVVAEEMQNLSDKTLMIANDMANRTRDRTSNLIAMIDSTIRGTRLSDLALVNIDLIDRNLYERTCDVRWWATDGSLVDVLTSTTKEAAEFASKRMGVILDAYTVYHDLVLCNRSGEIIANGRPQDFASVGQQQSGSEWFARAMATRSGDEYGFQSAHNSPLVNEHATLIYSCSVRENGESSGRTLGALGILFDWHALANPILENIPVSPSEKEITDAYIVNAEGQILASNKGNAIGQDLRLPKFGNVLQNKTGFYVTTIDNKRVCVGHARAPGFETYTTGWYSIIVQPLES